MSTSNLLEGFFGRVSVWVAAHLRGPRHGENLAFISNGQTLTCDSGVEYCSSGDGFFFFFLGSANFLGKPKIGEDGDGNVYGFLYFCWVFAMGCVYIPVSAGIEFMDFLVYTLVD